MSSRTLADGVGEQAPQAEAGALRRRRRRSDGPPRHRRLPGPSRRESAQFSGLFEIADERVLQGDGPAGSHEIGRPAGREHTPRIHQRETVATLGLVHEMSRDEDRHALVARQIDERFPELVAGERIDA